MINTFVRQLAATGYREMGGCEYGVNNLYVVLEAVPYVVSIIDCESVPETSQNYFRSVQHKITRAFEANGYVEVRILTIFFTNQVNQIKLATSGLKAHWLVAKYDRQILVYENQPADFLNAREILETVVYGSVQEKRNDYRKQSIFTINNLIILLNLAVFVITAIGGNTLDAEYMRDCGAVHPKDVLRYGEFYRLFVAIFLHFGIGHLAGNMLMLFFMGNMLERYAGKVRYLIIYLGGGLFSSLVSCLFYYMFRPNSVCAGASGAIFAVIGGLIAVGLFDKTVKYRLEPISIILLALYVLESGFTSTGVDNVAHVVGLVSGFLISMFAIKLGKR